LISADAQETPKQEAERRENPDEGIQNPLSPEETPALVEGDQQEQNPESGKGREEKEADCQNTRELRMYFFEPSIRKA
jgi:hypothetical protein